MGTGKSIAAVAGAAALVALGAGGLTAASQDVPSPEEVRVDVAKQAPRMLVDDPQNQLSPTDKARLERDASEFTFPDTVQTVHFLVFGESRDNLNDTVEEYLRDNHPDEIGTDKFADGTLIVAVGTDKRNVGIYGGEDVDRQVRIRDRVDEINEAMKPGMREGNIPGGLIAGLRKASKPEEVENYLVTSAKNDRAGTAIGAGAGAGALTFGGGAIGAVVAGNRRKAIERAREQHGQITREYADLAQRLDEVDIRANSLTSAFADNELRRDWAEVRDRFLQLHETVSGPGGVGSIDPNDDKQLFNNRAMLDDAARTSTQVSNAEDNINRLFAVENGDQAARRSQLTDLRKDLKRALLDVHDDQLRSRLNELETRLDQLDRNPGAPNFVDDLVRFLDDYGVVMQAVKEREFSDVKERHKLERPRIWDTGYYYPNYVPYVVLNNWHSSNVEAEQQAQAQASTSSNTSFSSGFSGAGGSSGY